MVLGVVTGLVTGLSGSTAGGMGVEAMPGSAEGTVIIGVAGVVTGLVTGVKGGLMVKSCCVVWINSLRCRYNQLLPDDFCILSFTS